MHISFHILAVLLLGVLGLVAVVEIATVLMVIHRGREVVHMTARYERVLQDAERRVLFVGDSTGVGVGAGTPEESIPGRFGADMPDVSIHNMSENGARVREVREQLEELPNDARYDFIMIMVGGNDVIRFTDAASFREGLRAVFALAREHTDTVAMMSSGNVGHAKGWPFLLRRVYDARSRTIRSIMLEETAKGDVVYIDVFIGDPSIDPFVQDPARYHATDGLHPSSEGYRMWYESFVERWISKEDHWLGRRYWSLKSID